MQSTEAPVAPAAPIDAPDEDRQRLILHAWVSSVIRRAETFLERPRAYDASSIVQELVDVAYRYQRSL